MYAISSDSDRRPKDAGPARPELPILFHLIDISRPRPAAESVTVAPQVTPPMATSVDARLPTPPAIPITPTELPAPVPSTVLTLSPLTAKVEVSSADDTVVASDASNESASSVTSTTDAKPATAAQPPTVTLKSNPADRRRKRTPASEDWFASHGKFITIAFVVALIGTVYFARTNRQQATPAKDGTATQSPLADHIVVPERDASASHVQTIAAVSDSKVELQPPSAPPLISGTTSSDKTAGDKLFDFPAPKRTEEQVAARPSPATSDKTRASESAAGQYAVPSATGAASQDSASALAPAYPVTTSPSSAPAYPTATSPTSAYPQTAARPVSPTTGGPSPSAVAAPPSYGPGPQAPANTTPNYRSQFPVQPPQQSPPTGWTPPTGTNLPGQYQPIDNTARGPRYERTGSGNY